MTYVLPDKTVVYGPGEFFFEFSSRGDEVVIGTGQSGPSLAARLAKAGRKAAIIERGRFAGTCVNTGCIPTKALVSSARAA